MEQVFKITSKKRLRYGAFFVLVTVGVTFNLQPEFPLHHHPHLRPG